MSRSVEDTAGTYHLKKQMAPMLLTSTASSPRVAGAVPPLKLGKQLICHDANASGKALFSSTNKSVPATAATPKTATATSCFSTGGKFETDREGYPRKMPKPGKSPIVGALGSPTRVKGTVHMERTFLPQLVAKKTADPDQVPSSPTSAAVSSPTGGDIRQSALLAGSSPTAADHEFAASPTLAAVSPATSPLTKSVMPRSGPTKRFVLAIQTVDDDPNGTISELACVELVGEVGLPVSNHHAPASPTSAAESYSPSLGGPGSPLLSPASSPGNWAQPDIEQGTSAGSGGPEIEVIERLLYVQQESTRTTMLDSLDHDSEESGTLPGDMLLQLIAFVEGDQDDGIERANKREPCAVTMLCHGSARGVLPFKPKEQVLVQRLADRANQAASTLVASKVAGGDEKVDIPANWTFFDTMKYATQACRESWKKSHRLDEFATYLGLEDIDGEPGALLDAVLLGRCCRTFFARERKRKEKADRKRNEAASPTSPVSTQGGAKKTASKVVGF